MSAEQLLRLRDDGRRHELVRGELRTRSLASAESGVIAANIIANLGAHVKREQLGRVYVSAGFQITRDPDTVRASSAAFVRAERVVKTPKFFEGPPDVAIEVVSPSDSYSEIEEQTLDWLRAGVRAVVIVEPRTTSVRLHRDARAINVTDVLQIDDVIPGWQMALSEIFD